MTRTCLWNKTKKLIFLLYSLLKEEHKPQKAEIQSKKKMKENKKGKTYKKAVEEGIKKKRMETDEEDRTTLTAFHGMTVLKMLTMKTMIDHFNMYLRTCNGRRFFLLCKFLGKRRNQTKCVYLFGGKRKILEFKQWA